MRVAAAAPRRRGQRSRGGTRRATRHPARRRSRCRLGDDAPHLPWLERVLEHERRDSFGDEFERPVLVLPRTRRPRPRSSPHAPRCCEPLRELGREAGGLLGSGRPSATAVARRSIRSRNRASASPPDWSPPPHVVRFENRRPPLTSRKCLRILLRMNAMNNGPWHPPVVQGHEHIRPARSTCSAGVRRTEKATTRGLRLLFGTL